MLMRKIGYIIRGIKEFPFLNGLYRVYTEYKIARGYKGRKGAEVFTEINTMNKWSGSDSVSGPGSDLTQTQVIIKEIPQLLQILGVKTFLDIPCGDHHWMKEVNLSEIQYIGGDIVSSIVDASNQLYGNSTKQFMVIDLTQDIVPPADFLLVRDCLVHLSFHEINSVLANLKRSKVTYLLTTTFPHTRRNYDITTGNWRPLNLLNPPFKFPQPRKIINEHCTESYGQYQDKSLGLWKIKDLPDSLSI